VVGVVGDVLTFGPARQPVPELFIPYTQPPPLAWDAFQRSMALVARTEGSPAPHTAAVRRAVAAVDATLPLFAVRTFDDQLAALTDGATFSTWVLTMLATAGLILSAVGIYGVVAYFVAQRTAEIGLRLALGATPGSVLALVVRHGAVLAAIGVLMGLSAALAVSRTLTTLLFEVTPTEPASYAVGAVLLFVVAMAACAVPAMRAIRIDPVRSLVGG
jgi:ABC-type antimicrobial peptide transport system permease subunit